jgi:hypothetical protein
MGLILIVVGVIHWSRGSIFMAVFGVLSLALAAAFTWAIRHNGELERSSSSSSSRTQTAA